MAVPMAGLMKGEGHTSRKGRLKYSGRRRVNIMFKCLEMKSVVLRAHITLAKTAQPEVTSMTVLWMV